MLIVILLFLLTNVSWAEGAFGTWKMNPARSTFTGDPHPRAVTVRIEPHPKGEMFTFDRIRADGGAATLSLILYLDGRERDFDSEECPGLQSSRRLDGRTVEIFCTCQERSVHFIRRLPAQPNQLILDITESFADGRHFERHLVLEKQNEK